MNMLSVADLSQKESFISGVRVQAGLYFGHAGWISIAKCSQRSCRNFTGGFRSWLDCPPPATFTRRSFDHHGKGNGNFVSKRVSKNEKKVVSLIDVKEMKTQNDCEIACDCVKRANVVLYVDLCKEIFAKKHTATHKPTSAQPTHCATMTHTDTHTHIHLQDRSSLRSPQASYERRRHRNCFPTRPAQAFPKK